MEAIREIRAVEQGQVIVQLRKESLRGCLHAYARPELISTEAEAWQMVILSRQSERMAIDE